MYKWQPQWTQYLIVMLAIEWISYSIIPKSLMKVEAVKWIYNYKSFLRESKLKAIEMNSANQLSAY